MVLHVQATPLISRIIIHHHLSTGLALHIGGMKMEGVRQFQDRRDLKICVRQPQRSFEKCVIQSPSSLEKCVKGTQGSLCMSLIQDQEELGLFSSAMFRDAHSLRLILHHTAEAHVRVVRNREHPGPSGNAQRARGFHP